MSETTNIDHTSVRTEPVEAQLPTVRLATAAPRLSNSEHAVVRLLAAGHTNAQIGQHLGRSEKTIRNQLTRIYAKLRVANRAQAVAVHMRMEFEQAWQSRESRLSA
jgi:two-component system, NarL family, nitrate/nitrite response regulator NarL